MYTRWGTGAGRRGRRVGSRRDARRHLDHGDRRARGRRSSRGQGPVRHRGRHDDLRVDHLRRPRPHRECRGRSPARGSGLRQRRQVEPARVRVRRDVDEPTLRLGAQPACSRSDRRRLERRLGGGARGRPCRRRARLRLGRLDPHPGRVLRHRRLQADVRPRVAGGVLAARAELRPRGTDGAGRRNVRRDDGGARGRLRADDARPRRPARRARLDGRGSARRPRARAGSRRALPTVRADRLSARAGAHPRVHARSRRGPPEPLRRARRRVRRGRRLEAARALLPRHRRRARGGGTGTRGAARRSGAAARGIRPAADADAGVRRPDVRRVRERRDPHFYHPFHEPLQRARLARARAAVRPGRAWIARIRADRRPPGGRCARPRGRIGARTP